MMSMNSMPLMPPWFWAANMSMRGSRIDRICDFGGRRPPVKPSTRRTDPGGDMALSTASISSGSSGSASICSRVRTELKALPLGSSSRTLPVATDGEALLHALDLQRDAAARIVAAAHAHVAHDGGLEPGELDLDRVAPFGQVVDDGHAGAAGDHGLPALHARGSVLGNHVHRGTRNNQPRRVADGDDEAAPTRRRLGRCRRARPGHDGTRRARRRRGGASTS